MSILKEKYKNEIIKQMMKDFSLTNVMQVPIIKKIVVNSGIGPFRENREAVDSFVQELTDSIGQKPFPTKARQSISNFKVRQNDTVGYAATLRGDTMWVFLEKLICISIPRIRDFRGLNDQTFDQNGNFSLGIKEHAIFPEVNPNTTKGNRSLQVNIVFSTKDIDMNRALLSNLGMPFKKAE